MACAGPVDGAAGDSQGKIGAVSEVNTLAGHVTPTLRDSVGVNASSVPADLFLNDGGVARFEARGGREPGLGGEQGAAAEDGQRGRAGRGDRARPPGGPRHGQRSRSQKTC